MSLLYIDGFDFLTTAQLGRRWPTSNAAQTQSTGGRFGGGCLNLNHTSNFVKRIFAQNASWVIGIALNFPSLPNASNAFIFLVDSVTVQCQVQLNIDGTLSVTRAGTALTGGTSTLVLTAGVWYYIEFKVTISDSIAANSCKVRVNGVDAITVATGQDTKNTANAYATALQLNGPVAFVNNFFDDLYVCDQSGSRNNDFLGDMRVDVIFPSGAGTTTQWTPSAGANYTCVDDPQANDDTDYVSSTTANQKDTYAMGNLIGNPVSIAGIQTSLLFRKDDAGSRTILPVIRSGGTDYEGSNVSVADSYTYASEIREVDPATSAAWTPTAINAMEAGIKLVS